MAIVELAQSQQSEPRRPRRRHRRALVLVLLCMATLGAYALWQPGMTVQDGRHDRGRNAIWLGHGWLGDDAWFTRNDRDPEAFRDAERIGELLTQLRAHGMTDLYPHLCPSSPVGPIAPHDPAQTDRFLQHADDFRVMPWIGGVRGQSAHPDFPAWRQRFIESAVALLSAHPQLAGLHVNIEPMPSGDEDFLTLLDELRAAMPAGKVLSVAAYPPPTWWQQAPEVHWDEAYFRSVAERSDQLVVMMYDTSIRLRKVYQHVFAEWVGEVLTWSGETPVVFGLPAYADHGVDYHHPRVENLEVSLPALHSGLDATALPDHYQGVAVYAHWTMTPEDWATLGKQFTARSSQ